MIFFFGSLITEFHGVGAFSAITLFVYFIVPSTSVSWWFSQWLQISQIVMFDRINQHKRIFSDKTTSP